MMIQSKITSVTSIKYRILYFTINERFKQDCAVNSHLIVFKSSYCQFTVTFDDKTLQLINTICVIENDFRRITQN